MTKAVAATQENSIPVMLKKYESEIARALPKHLTPDRMTRIALTEIRKNPGLAKADPVSFLGAIVQCAQLGLEPGNALGHAYLIPFNNRKKGITEVNLIPGYRGLIDLARRSGKIKSITAQVVKENDFFEYELGLNEELRHRPARKDRGETIYVYAVAKLMDGGTQFEVMDIDEVNRIKDMARYENPVWKEHFDEMARKTAVRRLFKYLPVSIEMQETMRLDSEIDSSKPQGNRRLLDPSYTTDYESDPDQVIDIKDLGDKAQAELDDDRRSKMIQVIRDNCDEKRAKTLNIDLLSLDMMDNKKIEMIFNAVQGR